jgi:hypothetical protein
MNKRSRPERIPLGLGLSPLIQEYESDIARPPFLPQTELELPIGIFAAIYWISAFAMTMVDIRTYPHLPVASTVLAFFGIASFLCLAVTFLIWFHGVYRNLEAFTPAVSASNPYLAVVLWLIPIVNLFRPFLLCREVWMKSDPGLNYSSTYEWESRDLSGLVTAWFYVRLIEFTAPVLITAGMFIFGMIGIAPPRVAITSEIIILIELMLMLLTVHAIDVRQVAKEISLVEMDARLGLSHHQGVQ